MAKQKLNLEMLEDEIDRLRRQLEEREAIKAEFSELYRQRQIVTELREKLIALRVPDSIDEREEMERAVDDGVEAIATAHHKLFPPEHRQPAESRSRRSSVDPEVMKQKEEFYFRRQAKINAGLTDSNGRPKKRLRQ
jgi:chromosome segregation ATPase